MYACVCVYKCCFHKVFSLCDRTLWNRVIYYWTETLHVNGKVNKIIPVLEIKFAF